MPPRKRRGRAKKAPDSNGKDRLVLEQVQDGDKEAQLEYEVAAEAVDPELLEAQSTIERLAKKYLQKSFETSSQSLDIVRGDSTILNGPVEAKVVEALSEGDENEEKENRLGEESPSPEDRPALRPRKRARMENSPLIILRRVKHHRAKRISEASVKDKIAQPGKPGKRPFASPDFILPKPTLGHSTPGELLGPNDDPRRDSLFGFADLESPLVLSPVPSATYVTDPDGSGGSPEHRQSPEDVRKPSSIQRLIGTYDIPIRKPTPKNKKRNAKANNKRSSLAEEEWIKKLASEFSEVDKFELVVE